MTMLSDLIMAWPEETLSKRCNNAIRLLVVHGIITGRERDNARVRLSNRLRKEKHKQESGE